MKIKKNDLVQIISGKEKGKKGKVLRVNPEKHLVVVEKINVVTKHMRKRQETAGEIIHFEAPIHASNVMVIDPQTNKKSRVKYTMTKEGKKQRVSESGTILDSNIPA